MDEITTTDLNKFGNRELVELRDLLTAWIEHGLPVDFEDDGIVPVFNTRSGFVFLSNADFQAAMLKDGKLESWYNCPCGKEGFFEDMAHQGDKDCEDYLASITKGREQ